MTERTAKPYVVIDNEGKEIDRFENIKFAQRLVDELTFVDRIDCSVTADHNTPRYNRPLTSIYLPDSGTYVARNWFVARRLKSSTRRELLRNLHAMHPGVFTKRQAAAYPTYVLAIIMEQI